MAQPKSTTNISKGQKAQNTQQKQAQKAQPVQLTCTVCKKPFWGLQGQTMGATCQAHVGKVGKSYKQAPINLNVANPNNAFISLSNLCTYGQSLGYSRGAVVRLCGGDAGTKAPYSPHFTVYIAPSGKNKKWCSVQAKQALQALANNASLPPYKAPTFAKS